jgi:hypothetical protein
MQQVQFAAAATSEDHECSSATEGDWIIFRCRRCPDYERWLNSRTGEMRAWNVKPDVRHFGHQMPIEHRVRPGYLH